MADSEVDPDAELADLRERLLAALEEAQNEEARYHLRQALQILELDE